MNLKRGKPEIKNGKFRITTVKNMIVNVVNLTAITGTGSKSTNSRRSLSNGTFGLETSRKLLFLNLY